MGHISDDPRYKKGLVPESQQGPTSGEWVPANAFSVRGIFPRGEAVKFSIDELTGVVRDWLAARDVELKHHDGFIFNYRPNYDMRAEHDAHDAHDERMR